MTIHTLATIIFAAAAITGWWRAFIWKANYVAVDGAADQLALEVCAHEQAEAKRQAQRVAASQAAARKRSKVGK